MQGFSDISAAVSIHWSCVPCSLITSKINERCSVWTNVSLSLYARIFPTVLLALRPRFCCLLQYSVLLCIMRPKRFSGPPLWSSGRSFWLQIQRSRVRSPALPEFLSSSGWGQLRSYLNEKSSGSRSRKQRLTAVGTRCADHATPLYPQKLALTSPTGGGRSVGV